MKVCPHKELLIAIMTGPAYQGVGPAWPPHVD